LDRKALQAVLERRLPKRLAEDLVEEFLEIRRDVSTGTLGRSTPGKFVESLVQSLQVLETERFDSQPNVDKYLRELESRGATLEEGLRVCGARVARAMYAFRNQRNIAHKGTVDPNQYDLRFVLAGAQWIMAEIIRLLAGLSMKDSGRLIEQVQAPVGGLVEDFGDHRVVLRADLSAREELLVLLHSHYPEPVPLRLIISSLNRRNPKTVRNNIRGLWNERLLELSDSDGYRLTTAGFDDAIELVARLVAA